MTDKQPKRESREGLDEYGRTPLHYAALNAQSEEVEILLAAGADPNAQDDDGWTPLHCAAQAVSPECTTALLQAGANPSVEDMHGNTPLWRAVFSSKGDGTVIMLLRQAGADHFARNKHGVAPISLARTIANYDVAKFFSDVKEPQT